MLESTPYEKGESKRIQPDKSYQAPSARKRTSNDGLTLQLMICRLSNAMWILAMLATKLACIQKFPAKYHHREIIGGFGVVFVIHLFHSSF
jgi:hypothetical protein